MARKTNLVSQRNKIRMYIVLILLIAVLAGFLDYPQIYNNSVDWVNSKLPLNIPHYLNMPFKLGLDLQGGTHLVYQADVSDIPGSEKDDAVEGVRDVIERRVNAFGVTEPLVQTNKVGNQYRVIVELAGIKDVREAIKMIGETPLLEFKEQNSEQAEITDEQRAEMEAYNQLASQRAEDVLVEVKANLDNFTQIAQEKSEDPDVGANKGDLGFIRNGYEHSEFFDAVSYIEQGQIYSEIFENVEGYNILKRGETQDEREVKANHILICYSGAERCEQDISKNEAKAKIEQLKAQATADNFIDLAKEHSSEPGAETSGGSLGYFGKGQMVPEFEEAAFALENGQISDIVETQFGYHLIYKTDERKDESIQVYRILIAKQTEANYADPFTYTGLTGKHLQKAQVTFNPTTNEAEVSLEFNDEGKDLFSEITGRNVNKVVGIFLDGEPISLPRVNQKISDGRAVITGKFTLEEAKTLTRRLNAGALPVPINLISQQTVGASLGHESLTLSLNAAVLGLILVGLFMIIYYRLPGVLAVLSLLVYGLILLAIFKLIPVTLTLAGIAGFILSVGMAVDANVLIFERIKEELKLDKPLGSAIDEGFKRAWPSIRDGNISTIITCIILYWFGTSIIQGFALTLFIGILVSMVSALLITRVFMNLVTAWRPISNIPWLLSYKKNKEEQES
ncbi:protein translocase subunit SecD [Patescibacteria group bacterium]